VWRSGVASGKLGKGGSDVGIRFGNLSMKPYG
jgi:hypothetical protein